MRYTRNGECWCGSGKKYKHCHFEFDQKIVDLRLMAVCAHPMS